MGMGESKEEEEEEEEEYARQTGERKKNFYERHECLCVTKCVVSLPHTKKVREESDKLRICMNFTEYCCTKVARFII